MKSSSLIDSLLEEQRNLPAAARFAQRHDEHGFPAQQKFYRDLIPLDAPPPGHQYAFEVNLDLCSGCKACVTACHSLNGLDETETWRSVGSLQGGDTVESFSQFITSSCHHCVDPACLSGCPTLAYEKDPRTGIVRHLDDQCIGCQYCVMKCPYDVPQYHQRKGIVRKCDLCSSRLAVGEAPACVQACPNEAIRITHVDQQSIAAQFRELSSRNSFLPGAPGPDYTLPTTRYLSQKSSLDLLRPESGRRPLPSPAHPPLIAMLVLTQLSTGLSILDFLAHKFLPGKIPPALLLADAGLAAVALLAGLTSSVLHLGRPLQAWRSFLGLRRSWLSREIVVFGAFAAAAATQLYLEFQASLTAGAFSSLTCLLGLAGVFCSAMLYHDTRREFWRLRKTAAQFFGTVLVLGSAGLALQLSWHAPFQAYLSVASFFTLFAASTKLILEFSLFNWPRPGLENSIHLLKSDLRGVLLLRAAAGLTGGVVLPLAIIVAQVVCQTHSAGTLAALCLGSFLLCVTGELLERHLFFSAVAPSNFAGITHS